MITITDKGAEKVHEFLASPATLPEVLAMRWKRRWEITT